MLPAVCYWLGMAWLTYFFVHLPEAPHASASPTESPPPSRPLPERTERLEDHAAAATAVAPPTEEEEAQSAAPADAVLLGEPEPALPQPSDAAGPADTPAPRRSATRAEPADAPPASRVPFPDFTDSSPPPRRERASDGPRIDGLLPSLAAEPGATAVAPAAPTSGSRDVRGTLLSCEAAIARNDETIELGAPRGPADITREAYAAVLQDGSYLSSCSIPRKTVFEICAAVRDGRAVGVTVTSSPTSPSLNACVRRAVSQLDFPPNPRLDVTHTRFEAQQR